MYQAQVYDKVYFNDDYSKQFQALRSRYHDRTQRALNGRTVDQNPTSNIAEFYYLNNEPDGGVSLTAGDLVDYFNQRYGGTDRIGAARQAIQNATKKVEKSREATKKQRSEKTMHADNALRCRMRFSRGHMVLVNMFFALMLAVSMVLLGASGVIPERSTAELAAVEQQATKTENVETITLFDGGEATVSAEYMSLPSENITEVYEKPATKSGFEAFLRVLSYLWQEV
ncbi:MAG: hypothetical protein IKC75_06355 [Clostridia bacterium]|nr:hypothetical protein [Clostridia bacterium]